MLSSLFLKKKFKRNIGRTIVAGIDNGTQSTKVVCYDVSSKEILALGQSPHDIIVGSDGAREQKAEWWVNALKSSFDQISPEIKKDIKAIGVSGQQHGFVPIDSDGNVLYNVKLWCDTSTTVECAEITKKYGGSELLLHDNCNLILPGYTASKILWLKTHQKALYDKLDTILLPHDYLNYLLTGEKTMECGDASGTALLDIKNRTWSKKLLKCIDSQRDLSKCLPRLIQSDDIAGHVTKKAANLFGIPEGALVSSGGGDNMQCAIGTGTVTNGVLIASLGTSGTLCGSSNKPIVDPEGNLAAFCSSTGSWLPLLCTMNCTVSIELARKLFNISLDEFNQISAKVPIGSNGVVIVPFFNGERTPNYPNGKGCICGLTPDNMKAENIYRASMEAAIFGLKLGLNSFMKLGFDAKEIRLVGGGSKSKLWSQMVADVCNLPTVSPDVPEAAAFGAALQAYWALLKSQGKSTSIEEITHEHVKTNSNAVYNPISENVVDYDLAYQKYLSYVENFKPIFSA